MRSAEGPQRLCEVRDVTHCTQQKEKNSQTQPEREEAKEKPTENKQKQKALFDSLCGGPVVLGLHQKDRAHNTGTAD